MTYSELLNLKEQKTLWNHFMISKYIEEKFFGHLSPPLLPPNATIAPLLTAIYLKGVETAN